MTKSSDSDNGNGKKADDKKKGFSPVNDLEKKLARIRSGRTTFLKAFNFLLNNMVVVLVKPAGEGEGAKEKQLVVRGPEGEPLVAIFSSGERAVEIVKHHKSYTIMKKMPGWQVVAALPKNRGLVVNPGSSIGFTVVPGELKKLRERFRLGGK
jgi:hypothetical protein